MELFTLGEGHYTEKDIKEAARALTGWTSFGNHFRFDRRQHDEGEKTILGTDQKMYLLHGFIKKSKTTPKKDLNLARNRKRQLESK